MLRISSIVMILAALCLAPPAAFGQLLAEAKEACRETKEAFKQSGRQLREDAKRSGRETREAFKQAGQEIRQEAKQLGTEVRDGLKRTGTEIKEAVTGR